MYRIKESGLAHRAAKICAMPFAIVVAGAFAFTLLALPASAQDDAVQASAAEVSVADDTVIAKYSGKTFTAADFEKAVKAVSPRARKTLEDPERRRQFIENSILSELIYAEGQRQGFNEDPEVRQQLEQLERRLVIQRVMQENQASPVSDEEIKEYYDANPQEFSTERIKASHILVSEEDLAKEIHAKLVADVSQFEALAKEHSVDRSNAERGGDLGFFGKNRMVKEFEEVVFALPEDGALSEPVKTRFGWHIIRRTAYEAGKIKDLEEVRSQIQVRLVNEKRTATTKAFLQTLKDKASLEIDAAALAALKLPVRAKGGEAKGKGGHP